MLAIEGLDHLVLRVADLDAMRRFYCELLGCEVARYKPEIGLLQLRAGDALIDLVPVNGLLGREGGAAPGREGRNLAHFCLRLSRFDAAQLHAYLTRHGVEVGEVKTRFGARGEGPSLYIDDPEGNTVELKGPPDPV